MQFRYSEDAWYGSQRFMLEPQACRIYFDQAENSSLWRPSCNELHITEDWRIAPAHFAHELGHKKCKAAATCYTPYYQHFILELCAWDYALLCSPENFKFLTWYDKKLGWRGLLFYAKAMYKEYGQEGWDLAKQAIIALLDKHNQKWNKRWDATRTNL